MEKVYIYLLIALTILIVVILLGSIIYYRMELRKTKTTLISYINENLEMKEKLPEYELPNFINNEEITPSEFSRIMTNIDYCVETVNGQQIRRKKINPLTVYS